MTCPEALKTRSVPPTLGYEFVSWDQRFFDPIMVPGRKLLVTLRDAALFITKLPKAEHDAEPIAVRSLGGKFRHWTWQADWGSLGRLGWVIRPAPCAAIFAQLRSLAKIAAQGAGRMTHPKRPRD